MGFSILVLDTTSETSTVGVVTNGQQTVSAQLTLKCGQAAKLPALVADVLASSSHRSIGLVAVTVGPGSFTGVRTGLAVAHALAAGWMCPVVGVGSVEGWVKQIRPTHRARSVWVALHSRTGCVFLDRDGILSSLALAALPSAPSALLLTGNAAESVATSLRQRGEPFDIADANSLDPEMIATIALQRHRGELPPLLAQPLYVNAPHTTVQAGRG